MSGEVGGTSESCPRRLFNARWASTPVKCGDDAQMLADTENIPADTPATFMVKRISDSGTITTTNNNTTASSVEGIWCSQKPSDNWNGAEVKFTVTGGGESADSQEEQLSFHKYPDISRTDFLQHRTSGIYGWDQAVKVELDDRVLIIHVPIKIRKCGDLPKRRKNEDYASYAGRWSPETYSSPRDDLSSAEKAALKNAIENVFDRQMAMHRTGCTRHTRSGGCPDQVTRKCCKFEIKVQVHFYNMNDSSAPSWASEVNYWNGADRANSANWFMDDLTNEPWVMAHEVGHLLGFYDEYQPDGACGSSPWQPSNSGALMGGGTRLETYYFNDYANWIGDSGRTNESWAVVPYS